MLYTLLKKKPNERTHKAVQAIGRFQLMAELGRGAQGVVYLAKDLELNRLVAIKTLLHKNKDGEQIFNEARNVSSLEHMNVIPLYEIGAHNDRPYLVYPYVEGITLREHINKLDKLTVMEATTIMAGVLDGLAHAHERGVVHRDLNPSNILLDENDNPRIMDFGIAGFAHHNTAEQDIVGTIQYLAPEQVNSQATGTWSDVFSIGVILFEMLTGHQLFKGKNSMVSIYKIINENILPPSSRNKSIDSKLDQIVMKALSKNTEERYNSAVEMKADLDRYLDTENDHANTVEAPVIDDQHNAREQATLLLLQRSIEKNPDFPVMGNNIISMMKLKEGEGCAEKLGEIILRDQSLSGKVLSLVNSGSYSQFGGEIKTVSRAIVILGLNQIQSLAVSIMVFEKLTNGPMAELLKSNACQSFLSAVFAKHLTRKSKSINSEEAFLASMFHNIGKQMIIYFLPDEYNEILNLVIDKGIDEDKASKRVLGISFAGVGQYISKEWQLPENIMQGIQPKPGKAVVKPASTKDYIWQLSALTNEIIETAALGNNERAEKRLKLIIKKYQSSFKMDYEKVIRMLNHLVKELIDYCNALNINYKKNTFCKNFISFVNHDFNFEDDEEAETEQAINNDKGFLESALTFGIAKIAGLLFRDYQFDAVANIAVNALHRGLECKHAVIFLRDPVNGEMRAAFGAGEEMDEVMRRFHFPVNEQEDLFNEVVRDKRDVFIPEIIRSPLLEKIPGWCKKTTKPKNLLIYPLINNDSCHGLIYVDNADAVASNSRQAFDYIDTLRKQVEQALRKTG